MNPLRILIVGLALNVFNFGGRWWALIPHVIGAILLIEASRRLADDSPRFAALRWIVFAQVAGTVGMFSAAMYRDAGEGGSSWISVASGLFMLVLVAIHLSMAYLVCRGIADLAARNWLPQLERQAMGRWRFYWMGFVVVMALSFGGLAITRTGRFSPVPMVVATALAFAVWIVLLSLVWRAGTLLRDRLALRL
ncbi:MAG: hypothetical protein ACRDJM_04510 [Actinomycetota bacterium]